MIQFEDFFHQLAQMGLGSFERSFKDALKTRFYDRIHGELAGWIDAINALPTIKPDCVDLKQTVNIGSPDQLKNTEQAQLIDCLKMLHPWRKGPFNLFGIDLDTEWRSNLKWQRVLPHIQPLQNRKILDVGCGNGYYCWQMLAEQPAWVLGIDPSQKFMMQFQIMKHFLPETPVHYLPIRDEDLPYRMAAFDTVFSMGVLYHRRSPFDHFEQLKHSLAPGGELVLETLIIDGGLHEVLVPADRYAQMRNVWFIPSCDTLKAWLERMGFEDVRVVDVSQTTIAEQRSTQWMSFHSLPNYLDPDNPELTVEGYPAPKRAIVIAQNPR